MQRERQRGVNRDGRIILAVAMNHRCFSPALVSFFLLSQLGYHPATAFPANGTGVHELLPKYGLPRGLLPQAVKSFSFSVTDGRFLLLLEQPCYVEFEYLIYYDVNITGTLHYGSITDLKGIQVRKFFIWFDIDEIKVDLPPSDCIYFQVGIITKRLDVSQFATPRSCREGGRTWWDSVSFEVMIKNTLLRKVMTKNTFSRKMPPLKTEKFATKSFQSQ